MKKIFSLFAAVLFAGSMMAADAKVVLNFTDSVWGFPADYEKTEKSYTNADSVTITILAASNGHKALVSNGAITGLIFGKKDATITFPAFDFAVGKIVVTGLSAASGKVTTNIFVGDEAVSTEITGSKEVNTFKIAAAKQAAGNVFVLKVTNDNNAQAAKIEIFEAEDEPQPENPWAEIVFDKAIAADALPADTTFEAEGLKLAIVDTDNKMAIDANSANFGTKDAFDSYAFRLKTGGKGSSKNAMTLTVPADGLLGIAVRTGSNSDTTRTLVLSQGADTLYNAVVKEADAVEVAVTDSTTAKVYPFVTVPVKAGDVAIGYPIGSLNFYAFGFLAAEPEVKIDTINVAKAVEIGKALAAGATTEAEYAVEGFVLKSQPFSLSYNNQIWYMADAATDSVSEFEAYGCVAVEGNDTLQVLDGDKVQLVGKITKYVNRNDSSVTIEIKSGVATFISKVEGDHTINRGAEQINVAKALEIAGKLATGETTPAQYEIIGYVTAMAGSNADGGWAQYGNQLFWIADELNGADSNDKGALEVYQGKAPEEVKVGDKISVKAQLTNYQGLLETAKGAPVTILEKAAAPELPEGVITCDSALVLARAIEDPAENEGTVEGPAVKVWGYVTYAYNATEKEGVLKQSAWLSDTQGAKSGVLQGAYLEIASAEAAVVKDDYVQLEGTLAKYRKRADEGLGEIVIEVINGKMTKVSELGVENIELTEKAQKVMVEGVLYIIRDNKMYNVQGIRVR